MERPIINTLYPPFPYGAIPTPEGVLFTLAAPNASSVKVGIFDTRGAELLHDHPLHPVHNRIGGVWHIFLDNLPLPCTYSWQVKRYGELEQEEVSSPWLLDPYAKEILFHDGWDTPSSSPWRSSPKGIVWVDEEPFDWEGIQSPALPLEQLVIYEMHLRSFTRDPSSRVRAAGTYLGVIEKIPYLLDLGINAVEIMPVLAFDERHSFFQDPMTGTPLLNVWGYSPISFIAPMAGYASSSPPLPGQTTREWKEMVREFHRAGIEVIVDVVFNHTGEGGEESPPFSWRGIDDSGYYLHDNSHRPLDFSGCGNTLHCNHPLVRELILTSLRYWVIEMGVDGFRFDLASVFYRGRQGHLLGNPPILESIAHDPWLAHTKMIAEPWDASGLYQVGAFYPQEDRFSEWNGKYRDSVRRFLKGQEDGKGEFATRISGSQDLYGQGRRPTSSINFITAHDGFTLADLVSYNQKHNEGNGEQNRDGSNDNMSWNCGVEGKSCDEALLILRKKQMRNFFLVLMTSQGVPMLLMGDEYGHTRKGNNNSYCQDNRLNWFCWDLLPERLELHRFFRGLIHWRKRQPLLQRTTFLTERDIRWHGVQPDKPNWEWTSPFLSFSLLDSSGVDQIYVAFNASPCPVEITLPSPHQAIHLERERPLWHRIADTALTPPQDFSEEEEAPPHYSSHYAMEAYSALLLQRLPSHKISIPSTPPTTVD